MVNNQETLCRECKEIITGRKIQFYQWSFHVKCWNDLMGLVENKNIVKEERLRVLIACEFSGIVR